MFESRNLAVRCGSEGGARGWMLQGMMNVGDASEDKVGGRRNGHGDFAGKPTDSVGDALGPSVPHPNSVAAVGLKSRANIPPIKSMGRPRAALVGFVVN